MWSTPLAQKGFLRICAQTRRDLSLVYNNPQWRIQGRDRGGGGPGHPLLLDQSEARRAEKKIFLRPGLPPPLPPLPPPPISGSGWPRLNKTDRHSHDYEGQESSKLRNTRK